MSRCFIMKFTLRPLKTKNVPAQSSRALSRCLKMVGAFAAGLFIQGCSDTETIDNISAPPLIIPVVAPFLKDQKLYEYIPEGKETKLLLDLSNTQFTPLDTDASSKDTDGSPQENNVQFHQPLIDFVAYVVNGQQLRLFQLDTRRDHELYDFASSGNPNGAEKICNIRASVIADVESFKAEQAILKEERAVYVEAVELSQGSCDSASDRRYYKMVVFESSDTYDIRRRVTTTNSNNVETTNIERVVLPILKAEKRVTDEALMYALGPIFVNSANRYGYIGFERNPAAVRFYSMDGVNLEVSPVWTVLSPEFELQAEQVVQSTLGKELYGARYRQARTVLSNANDILFEHGWDLISLPKSALFDDDSDTLVANRLLTPVFDRATGNINQYSPLDITQSISDSSLFIQQGQRLTTLSGAQYAQTRFEFPDTDIERLDLSLVNSTVLAQKHYQAPQDNESSIVTLNQNIESTILPRSAVQTRLFSLPTQAFAFANSEDRSNSNRLTWSSRLYRNNTTTPASKDSLYISGIDERSYHNHDEGPTFEAFVLSSKALVNSDSRPALVNPTLHSANLTPAPNGTDFDPTRVLHALLPNTDITESPLNRFTLVSDEFALLELMTLSDDNTQSLQLYYVNPFNTFKDLTDSPVAAQPIEVPSSVP